METPSAVSESESWQDLSGKVVMVTGASSGLGEEFCLDLAKAGCKIIASARRVERLKALCSEINRPGFINDEIGSAVRAVPVELDVAGNGSTIEASVTKAWNAFGRIDVLINNAGIVGVNRCCINGTGAYSSSKTALNTMTKCMAMELGVHNIRVNCINPGLFKSEITESLMNKSWMNEVAQKIIPLRTYGTTNPALTSLIRYLIHDSSLYISETV